MARYVAHGSVLVFEFFSVTLLSAAGKRGPATIMEVLALCRGGSKVARTTWPLNANCVEGGASPVHTSHALGPVGFIGRKTHFTCFPHSNKTCGLDPNGNGSSLYTNVEGISGGQGSDGCKCFHADSKLALDNLMPKLLFPRTSPQLPDMVADIAAAFCKSSTVAGSHKMRNSSLRRPDSSFGAAQTLLNPVRVSNLR